MAGDFTEETAADAVIESFADTPELRAGGAANGRALAHLAHLYLL
jgi:hypothetical protein